MENKFENKKIQNILILHRGHLSYQHQFILEAYSKLKCVDITLLNLDKEPFQRKEVGLYTCFIDSF